jgi:hypothetical protein
MVEQISLLVWNEISQYLEQDDKINLMLSSSQLSGLRNYFEHIEVKENMKKKYQKYISKYYFFKIVLPNTTQNIKITKFGIIRLF